MSAYSMTVTQAGLALIAAGPLPLEITAVAIGSGSWGSPPPDTTTALSAQIKQITAIEGTAAAADMIHITAVDSTTDTYSVREIGLYVGTTLVAIYGQSAVIFTKAGAGFSGFAGDFKFKNIPAGSITVGATNFGYPQATETTKGVAEIATQAECDAETDDQRMVTPLKLAARLKKAVPIGTLLMWPSQTVPSGYLERDGSAISRTTYAALFAIIGTTFGAGNGTTTFNLPDDRDLFERGWDHVRAFGSYQADSFQGHHHSLLYPFTGSFGGGLTVALDTNTNTSILSNYAADPISDGVSGSPRFSGETRPKNRAYLPIIRAY